ncbi:MAG TPA: hypothetical protein VFD59_18760 [Nocardioidaceae bacterium]|nr:hypothetical protein [Nocardioidaceae bacterium]
MLAELPDTAIDSFLALTGPGSHSSLLMAELRQLGGALGRPHDGAGALPMLEGPFALFAAAIAATPELGAQGHADATALVDALSPYATGRQYLNLAENPVEMSESFAPDTWTQLKETRAAIDPDDLFVANHAVR